MDVDDDDDYYDDVDYNNGRPDSGGESQLRSRPGTGVSHASLFSASRANESRMDDEASLNSDNGGDGGKEKGPAPPMLTFGLIRFAIYFLVLLGVVVLCLISAYISIVTLLETKDIPASSYAQFSEPQKYVNPGIIFMARGLQIRDCDVFNFTSLNIDELFKRKLCYEQQFTLNHYDDISLLGVELHEVLQYVKDTKSELTVHLIKGPSDWSNKQTVMAHLTVPKDQSGAWGIIHPDYEQIANKFSASSFEGALPTVKWELVQDLLVNSFTTNLVPGNFRALFLMTKNEFKNFGVTDAVNFDMEISLMEINQTRLDMVVRAAGDNPRDFSQFEAIYQWKDNYFMQGDSLYTVTVWAIVTVICSALLMLERGYNTLKKAWGQAKAKKAAKAPPNPPGGEAAPAVPPDAAPTDGAAKNTK